MSFHHTHLFILAAVDCGMEGGSSKGDVEALRISTFLDRSSVSIMMTIMVMVVMMICVMKWKLISIDLSSFSMKTLVRLFNMMTF